MNSFLFNVGIISLAGVAVVQFCATSFAAYTSNSQINFIFAFAIGNLRILSYFWQIYTYILLGFMFITAIYIFFRRKEKRVSKLGKLH